MYGSIIPQVGAKGKNKKAKEMRNKEIFVQVKNGLTRGQA